MPYKITTGVKLKNLPLEQRVMLRLTWVREQRKATAALRTIAKEIGSTFMEVMKCVESLAQQKAIIFKPVTANEFEFTIDTASLPNLQLAASCYQKHLTVRAAKGLPAATKPPPAHLTPITEEMRAPVMDRALTLAARIGAPKLADKVANCIVRIGDGEVVKLVEHVLANKTDGVSYVRAFFTLYSVRRDLLVPAMKA